jgi:hypothetical protein
VRRAAAVLFFVLLAGVGSWLAVTGLKSDPFPLGAPLPTLTFRDGARAYRLSPDTAHPTLVVWFHSQCVHCRQELETLNRSRAQLGRSRIYLLSGEDSLPLARLASSWPALAASPQNTWGLTSTKEFEGAFGTSLTPALFAFDGRGRLVHKVIGESKLDNLIAVLAERSAPESASAAR